MIIVINDYPYLNWRAAKAYLLLSGIQLPSEDRDGLLYYRPGQIGKLAGKHLQSRGWKFEVLAIC